MRFLPTLFLCALFGFCHANDPAQARFAIPEMKTPPQIDGRIQPGEWKDAVSLYGTVRHNSPYLSTRRASLSFGLDKKYVYLVCRSELPPEGMELSARARKRDGAVYLDDNVEFLLCPPKEDFVYQIMVNCKGFTFDRKYPVVNGGTTPADARDWNPDALIRSSLEDGFWTLEMRIPLSDFGVTGAPEKNQVWRMLAGRNWCHPMQQTTLKKVQYFTNPEEMVPFTFSPDLPHVSFNGLGEKEKEGSFRLSFTVDNATQQPREIQYRITVVSDASPRQADSTITVPAGKSVPVELSFTEKTQVIRTLHAVFQDVKSGQVLYERTFSWDPADKLRWKDPKTKQGAELEIGVYPYYKKIRARFGTPAEPVSNWKSAVFSVRRDGREVSSLNAEKTPWGFEAEIPFEPAAGKYTLQADMIDGTDAKIVRSRPFEIEKFPWEHNSIGCERIVIPPFQPLTYPGSREARATLTSYSFRDGFFDRIAAGDAPDILAAPISLKVNGEILLESSFRFTEKSPDRARTESVLAWKGGSILVNGEFDYDGFCKFTMTVRPNGKQDIREAVLAVPLKGEYAKLVHSVCNQMKYNDADFIPPGNGVVWRSSQTKLHPQLRGNFRPYVWFGDTEKGIAWMSESDRFWSLSPDRDALELVRSADRVTLNVNMVNKPTVWEREFTIQQAFQATPVKPQPEYRRRLMERVKFVNAWNLCTLAGPACWSGGLGAAYFHPLNEDYSYVNLLKKRQFSKEGDEQFIEAFIERNAASQPEDMKSFLRRHLQRGIAFAKMGDYLIPYINARFSHMDWRDYKTYMDEWWCSEYRAENADEYNNTPVKSYQDMALWNLRRLVREGLDGIYYDNIRDWSNPNPVTGPAYRREDGTMQPYFDLFALREFARRTATMLYVEKKTFPDGRPVLTFHMTNTNIVPVLSFGTIALDLEAQYGSKDYQDRFSEGYLRSCTIGTQTGVIPEILIQITGNNRAFTTRTFLSVTLAYELPFVLNAGGVENDWFKVWGKLYAFGYSTPQVEVRPCWVEKDVKTSCADWRLTTYRKASSGETVIAVCSFGKTARGTVDFSGLGQGPFRCTDFETGTEIPSSGGKVSLEIKKHDFRLLLVSEQR
ncbi:MAG: hypothetical protein BWY31_04572 [Lentisphaerae bacterium ADurb.Bin242]|nr:MAG: hypothetical protein BWY31_04572 [Lentisphaerae bacterium ADurb.Bin242]